LRRLTRSPLVHFVLLGGLLFAARHPLLTREQAAGAPVVRDPIVIPIERVRALADEFTGRWDRSPNEAEQRALVEQAAQEEALFREARLLALGSGDGSVRRRLVEKMRLVGDRPGRSEDELVQEASALGLDDDAVIRRLLVEKMRLVLRQEAGATPIADAELAAYLARHRAELAQPERVTFTQVFLAADARGTRLVADARRTLVRLRSSGVSPERAAALSDPSPLATRLQAVTRPQLVGRFGERFAEEVMRLEPGAWSGPLASPYGLHLVRVEMKLPARLPAIDEVRPALTRAVLRERAQQSLARGLARLRQLYAVRVETGGEQAANVPVTESAS
jgi:hypothetical protein